MKLNKSFKRSKTGFLSLCVAAAAAGVPYHALAQDSETIQEEVVVTGFRQSLQDAALAKRNAVNVTDSVFAEDIGKFSDLNIAEAINRVPGMQLVREVDGSGVNISIRGLGTNFTKILMNGTQVAVATSGRTDAQNGNREVDLDLFPTELFTRLDVSKTPTASMLEGGVSGTVNMRTARPFDNPGTHVSYQIQASYGELSEKYSPRASVIGSFTNDDETFGVLGGLAIVNNKVVTQGYETFGWTNANLRYNQCGVAEADLPDSDDPENPTQITDAAGGFNDGQCNPIGGGDFVIPATVPAGVGNGLTEGDVIDRDFLLANNPGLSIEQISDGMFPRIGRPHYSEGDRDRISGLLSFEFRPADNQEYYLDMLYSEGDRDFNRLDMMLIGRNSQVIPLNMEVDSNNVITSATFANAQFFLEARPYKEDVDYLSVNPGMHFEFTDTITLDAQVNYSKSDWFREAPTVGVTTNLGEGVTAIFRNEGGDIPITTAIDADGNEIDLNNPDQIAGWGWERALVQNERRETETKGLHVDLRFGDEANNIKIGVAYDEASRLIEGLDNSGEWENFACRGGYIDGSADPRPGCRGVPGSAIENSELADYLVPSEAGFISVDYAAIFEATNYQFYSDTAPVNNSSATGARSGDIEEENWGLYIEANSTAEIAEREARLNMGIRYVTTDQTVGGPVTFQDEWQYLESDYEAFLPSFNGALDLTDDVVLRVSASQSLTRANPTQMLPSTSFSDPSAQEASQGNPELAPFKSTNFDFGAEWYTGEEGYVALNYFHKQLTGFTVDGERQVPFTELGIPFDELSDVQQSSINERGGPNVAEVTVSTQINSDGLLSVTGYEFTWAQPLSVVTDGLGFNFNYTDISQRTEGGGLPAVITGTSPVTYNFTGYYENYGFTARLSYTWYDEQYQSQLGNNGIDVYRYQEARGQWDASASYEFENMPTSPAITLNVINFAGDPERQIFGYSNAPYLYYDPGYQVILGLRGTF